MCETEDSLFLVDLFGFLPSSICNEHYEQCTYIAAMNRLQAAFTYMPYTEYWETLLGPIYVDFFDLEFKLGESMRGFGSVSNIMS